MKRILYIILIFLVLNIWVEGKEEQLYKVGSTEIYISPPINSMEEVGDDIRNQLETFKLSKNKLIAVFWLSDELRKMKRGKEFDTYTNAFVDIIPSLERIYVDEEDFKFFVSHISNISEEKFNLLQKEGEKDFNTRMEKINLNDLKLNITNVVDLGLIFSKKNAFGFGKIISGEVHGKVKYSVVGGAFVRIKGKIVCFYIGKEYTGEKSIEWVADTLEEWTDTVIEINQ